MLVTLCQFAAHQSVASGDAALMEAEKVSAAAAPPVASRLQLEEEAMLLHWWAQRKEAVYAQEAVAATSKRQETSSSLTAVFDSLLGTSNLAPPPLDPFDQSFGF